MRKFSIFLLAALLLLISNLTLAAKTPEELSDLARYYPSTATVYASIRTDAAFIDELDPVLANLDDGLGGALEGLSVRDALDQVAKQFDPEGSFDTTFAWLGETAAIGLLVADPDSVPVTEDVPNILAIAVSDSAAAETFLDNLAPVTYEKEENQDGGILYHPVEGSRSLPTVYLAEDVLLFRESSIEPETIIPTFDESLADSADFQAAISRLPLADYNAIAYVDPIILEAALAEAQDELDAQVLPTALDLVALAEAFGPQAAGFTLLDGRNLVVDIAIQVADPEAFAAAGGRLRGSEAIDLSFANYLPAETALYLQDTSLGQSIIEGLVQLETIGDFYDEQYEEGNLDFEQYDLMQLDEAAVFIRQSLEGLSGLTLEAAFGWMTGDYALYLNVLPGISEDIPALPDLGVIVAATDTNAATALDAAADDVLYQLGIDTVEESGFTVIPVFGDMLGTDSLDLVIGTNGSIFAAGTRPTTLAALNGEGGLADSPAYQYASQFFLEDTQVLAYAYFPPLAEMSISLAEIDSDFRDLAQLLPLFESGSITATYDENGAAIARLVLSLAE